MAGSLDTIALSFYEIGNHDEALELYNRALAIRVEKLGRRHLDTATAYKNIGDVFLEKQQPR